MDREEIIEKLKDWSDSIGPIINFNTFEDCMRLDDDRYRTIEESSIDILVDILKNPPYNEIAPIPSEDFAMELVGVISFIGRKNPKDIFIKLKEIIYVTETRRLIIEIIGNLKDSDGIQLLKLLLKENLTDNEIIELVDSLCEIGGSESKRILEDLKIKYKNKSPEVQKEIDVCLSYFKDIRGFS